MPARRSPASTLSLVNVTCFTWPRSSRKISPGRAGVAISAASAPFGPSTKLRTSSSPAIGRDRFFPVSSIRATSRSPWSSTRK